MNPPWQESLQRDLGTNYRIREELGGGGMSKTFVAEETALQRSVVLKVLSPALAAGLSVERFEREIHLAARLQHAFIVPLLAAGVADGLPWYTMPLVQGDSLRARLEREGAMTPIATIRVLKDVAEALAYAHAQGVVHRDIKPDNILLSRAHALVTDFGVAKAIGASAAGPTMTEVGVAVGTPAYMAPEQASADANADHRVDLYALGATAYEMLTGRPMFGNRSPGAMLVAHASETPDALSKIAPGIPLELTQLIEQLLAKHPNDRPARADDVAHRLAEMATRFTSGDVVPVPRMTLGRAIALWSAAFVGVVGAAWLAVRWLPVPEWTLGAAVLLMIAGLPVLAVTAWLHRPAKSLGALPSVASSTATGRIEAVARPLMTWQRASRGGVIAVGALIVVAGLWAASWSLGIGPAATLRSRGVVSETDQVFVADFESPASDTGLGLVVAELLRAEIARSRLNLLLTSDQRSRVLSAMRLPPTTRIGSQLAREFAERANAKVFLSGFIAKLGSGYLLRATLFETSTGRELEPFREVARSQDDIISAVDKLGREARSKLGASLREVRGSNRLSLAVTPSLQAARQYAEAQRIVNQNGDQAVALQALERAVKIDTEFAVAYRAMSAYYANIGISERMAWSIERAFKFRSRVSDLDRFQIEGLYYANSTRPNLDSAIAAYEAALEIDSTSGNNVGLSFQAKRDFDRAITVYRAAIKSDSNTCLFAAQNILTSFWEANRKAEAKAWIDTSLTRRRCGPVTLLGIRASLASADLHVDSAEIVRERAARDTSGSRAQRADRFIGLAATQRALGRLAASEESQRQALLLNPSMDTVDRYPLSVLRRAEVLTWERDSGAAARRILDSASALHPPGDAGPLGYRWIELITAYARAGDAAKARTLLKEYEQRDPVYFRTGRRQPLSLALGWIAMAERRYGDAITEFRSADVGECLICSLAPLGYAFDLAGVPDSAIVTLERYVNTNYWGRGPSARVFLDGRYLAPTYKRLAELYDAKGDVEHAAQYYTRFVDLWKNADAELQPKVAQARQRLAVLHRREGSK